MTKPTTLRQFFQKFPDDDTCLKHLFDVRFGQGHECPKCQREAKWYPIKAERAFSCQWCGHHIHPMVGTLFEKSRTPLQLWFYAIFLFTTTRHGVSAKELQRQLGVTYKCAWRMGHQIREHMAEVDGDDPLGGVGINVEVDETLIGGSVSGKGQGYKGNKTCVVGMLERDGEIVTQVVKGRDKVSMKGVILTHVLPGTTLQTDEFGGYKDIDKSGFRHVKVNHNRGEYAREDGAGVNGIESYWAQLKRGINGTHIHVSGKHLPKYAKEFEYRFNRRTRPEKMLSELLTTFEPTS
ncbi:IS1595 family transposase [Thalassospiraceae bacterium LMO-JJ14]|nr:IS1595 family transposase [Thalassospiraceae bacterium LMO-JJ14]